MPSLPLHPVVVHVPLGVCVIMPLVLVVLTLALKRGWATKRAFLLAGLMQAVVVVGAGVSIVTGEVDEERIEATVPEALVEPHERLGQVFLAASALSLVLVVLTAVVRASWTKRLAIASTLASLGVVGAAIAVGHTGGELVYRRGAAAGYAVGWPK